MTENIMRIIKSKMEDAGFLAGNVYVVSSTLALDGREAQVNITDVRTERSYEIILRMIDK